MKIHPIPQADFEELWEATEPACQFHAFIALHSLKRGPALGGVRLWQYDSPQAARQEVLRLARAMTYKAAVANLPHGGGKAVILQPKGKFDRAALMECFSQFIDSLQGKYLTAKDVGTSAQDMALIRQGTPWVTGLPTETGGAGDPSPMTAYGVLIGIRTGVAQLSGSQNLSGTTVALQGLGGVGAELARLLTQSGSQVWATDLNSKRLFQVSAKLKLHPLLPEQIFETKTTVFSPCALGQVLDEQTIGKLKAQLVAGAANDPLQEDSRDARHLQKRGVLYAPDFVINAGGLIHVALEWKGKDAQAVKKQVEQIGPTLQEIFALSQSKNITTLEAALRVAEARL